MHSSAAPIPSPSASTANALDNLRSAGVAVLRTAFSVEQIADARRRLAEVAEAEHAAGVAIMDDGSSASGQLVCGVNQRVVDLLDKGAAFRVLAADPLLAGIAGALFAEGYGYPAEVVDRLDLDAVLLSSVTANIANTGGHEMQLHADQGFAPPSTAFPLVLNVVVPLVAFTAHNGATRVAPGSHLADPLPLHVRPPATVPAEADVGDVILLDGRTWHGTGTNSTAVGRPALLITYCRPWVRRFDEVGDHTVGATAGVGATLSPVDRRIARLQGRYRWFVYGADDDARAVTAPSG